MLVTRAPGVLPAQSYLIFFTMLYMSIMLCNALLTNRYISLSSHTFVLGGAFTVPFFFILGDIIAEIFGYQVAKKMVWYGFICQTIFALICEVVIHAPYPIFFKEQSAYTIVFDQLLFIDISLFIAFIVSSLVNVHIISQWKILLQGKHFWLRSLGASLIAEALYVALATLMIELGAIPLDNLYQIILISFLIKVAYSIIFSGPANMLVNYIKMSTGINMHTEVNLNPFIRSKEGVEDEEPEGRG